MSPAAVPAEPRSPGTVWVLPDSQAAPDEALAGELGLPPVAMRLLARRGFTSREEIRRFLSPQLSDLHDPVALPDISRAAKRIARAIRGRERILIFGDYDVDGTTATALLVRTLAQLGGEVGFYTPHRAREGYGLSETGIRQAREGGYSLVVTADCGTTDFEEIALARELGLDVIVTDHHELGSSFIESSAAPSSAGRSSKNDERRTNLPNALAVVNPKRPDSSYPFDELCGCGVAFKLAQAVSREMGSPPEAVHEHLDLVALATIADVVPLSGENRILAKIGLMQLRRTRKPGLQALLEVTRLRGRELGSHDVGFILGPRINASGRIGEGADAVQLMLTEDRAEATRIARELDEANRLRRAIEDATVEQAQKQVERLGLDRRDVLVLADEGWHEGVIGIVASRIVDRFYRPTIMIALDGDRGKGSGRSISGFHLHDALKVCAGDLLGFGGHKYAAGLTIRRDKLADFDRHMNEHAARCLTPELRRRKLYVDARVALAEVDRALLEVLGRFEPFGPENLRPNFAAFGLEIVGFPRVVGEKHLRLTVRENKSLVMPAIAWGRSEDLLWLETGKEDYLDIVFQFEENTFAGRARLQLQIKDLRRHAEPTTDGGLGAVGHGF